MGGVGSGGRRSGAGRKKKPTHLRAIDGGASHRGPGLDLGQAPAITESPCVDVPADLTLEELAVWQAWAPLAHEQRTLTPATVSNFVHLCALEVDRRELRARYVPARSPVTGELLALVVHDSDEELSFRKEHRALAKDIKAMMKDFKLAPFGKEILSYGKAEDADPLDAFTRKRG